MCERKIHTLLDLMHTFFSIISINGSEEFEEKKCAKKNKLAFSRASSPL